LGRGGEPLVGGANERFGYSIALSQNGNVLAVGAPFAGLDQAGMVQVYSYELQNNGNGKKRQWVPRGPALVGRNAQDQFGSSVALSNDGSVLVASEPTFDGIAGDRSGNVRAFVFSPLNRYDPLGQDIQGEAATDHFGVSVGLSGNGLRLAVGAPFHDTGVTTGTRNTSGQARVFEFSNGRWKFLGGALAGATNLDWFGWSLDLSQDGTFLAVGAPRNLQYGGYVRSYHFRNGDWVALPEIFNSIRPTRYDDNFGHVVSVSGNNRVAIGSPGKNVDEINSGLAAAYELDTNNDKWTLVGSAITAENPQPNLQLGFAIDLEGDILAVGIPGFEERGQVCLYSYTNGNWIMNPNPLAGDREAQFGFSLRLTQDMTLAVGSAVTSESSAGSVGVYRPQ
jgi:hypothetical protein